MARRKTVDILNEIASEDTGAVVGRTVGYVLQDGTTRPAMVTFAPDEFGLIDLIVFMNGTVDGFAPDNCLQWYGSISRSESKQAGTWHTWTWGSK